MTEYSRRAFLAGGVAGVSALAGCTDVPFLGDSEEAPEYDAERLREAADPATVPDPSTYPGSVPIHLATAHYERGRELLADVPEAPSFPNEVVTRRLQRLRERAAENFADPPADVSSLDALGDWRYDRSEAAEVRGAYEAATGKLTRGDVDDRRYAVRGDLASSRESWTYRGETVVDAFAVHRRLERLAHRARRSLAGRSPLPQDLQSAVFDAGEAVSDVERAGAAVADAAELRDGYVTDGMDAHWATISTAAARLDRAVGATRRESVPSLDRDADSDDLQRDVAGTPAEQLFWEAQRIVVGVTRWSGDAADRGDYATAVARSGRALTGLLAADTAMSAIRDGDYGHPSSTDEILGARRRAHEAVTDVVTVAPAMVAGVVSEPATRALVDAERDLAGRDPQTNDDTPDRRDVVRAVGLYALAEHAADAVPAVVDRVVSELDAGSA